MRHLSIGGVCFVGAVLVAAFHVASQEPPVPAPPEGAPPARNEAPGESALPAEAELPVAPESPPRGTVEEPPPVPQRPAVEDSPEQRRAWGERVVRGVQAAVNAAPALSGSRIDLLRIDAGDDGLIARLEGRVNRSDRVPALVALIENWPSTEEGRRILAERPGAAVVLAAEAVAVEPPEPVVEILSPAEQRELDRLMWQVRSDMSVHPALQADAVDGYRIVRTGDHRRLEVDLRTGYRENPAAEERLVREILAADRYWLTANPPIDEVVIVPRPGAEGRADRLLYWLQRGRLSFRHCDFENARTAYQQALQQSPAGATRAAANYRAALCDLALGRHDLVRERLDWLLEEDPLGSSSPNVAVALEDVQGPLRIALVQTERYVLLERARREIGSDAMPAVPSRIPAAPAPTPYDERPGRPVTPPTPTPPPTPMPPLEPVTHAPSGVPKAALRFPTSD